MVSVALEELAVLGSESTSMWCIVKPELLTLVIPASASAHSGLGDPPVGVQLSSVLPARALARRGRAGLGLAQRVNPRGREEDDMHYGSGRRLRSLVAVAALGACLAAVGGTARAQFGTQGKIIDAVGTFSGADAVSIDGSARIVVASGTNVQGPDSDFFAERYTPQGNADIGFGLAGLRVIDTPGEDSVHAALALPKGKVLLAGPAGSDSKVVRLRPNGALDTSFSGDGVATVDGVESIEDIARQRDGKIVVVGSAGTAMVVARLRANGSLDTGFANGGKRVVAIDALSIAAGVAVRPNGRIVAVGRAAPDPFTVNQRPAVVQLRPNGKFDKSFAGNGRKRVKVPGGAGLEDVVIRGKRIVGAGTGYPGGTARPLLVALRPNGRLDRNFAGKGKRVYNLGAPARAWAIGLQKRKFVIAGDRSNPVADFLVARFAGNGKLDKSFSSKGWRATDFGFGDFGIDLAVQADSKIVVAGYADEDIGIARYRKNGALDK